MSKRFLITLALGIALAVGFGAVGAQQVTGTPGSPGATTRRLPAVSYRRRIRSGGA